MMSAILEQTETTRKPEGYPFHIGRRIRFYVDAQGQQQSDYVPLTEEDFVHPLEEDQFMTTQRHRDTISYLQYVIATSCRDYQKLQAFTEQIIDWQHEYIRPHGPDVSVFDPIDQGHDPSTGTVHVKDLHANVIAVFEVTSESTRHKDLGEKFDDYEEIGVPYYFVVDLAAPNGDPRLLAFRLVSGRYREMREIDKLGYQIPHFKLWFRLDGDRLVAADEDYKDIPGPEEQKQLTDEANARFEVEKQRAETEKQRAEAEKQRAEAEKQRAEAEKQRAEAEKQRADALAAELAALKSRLDGTTTKD